MATRLLRTLLLFAAMFLSAGAFAQVSQDYTLGAGDAIRVQVFQNPDLTVEARVSESGTISYPLIGTMQLGGLSIAAAEK